MCLLLKQITLHRYGNGMGERGNPAFSFRTWVSFQGRACSWRGEIFLAKRLPRKNVQFDSLVLTSSVHFLCTDLPNCDI